MKENNCKVLQCGNSASDHAHVKKVTPLDTKRAELAMIPKEDRVNPKTTAKRQDRDKASVRPL